MPPTDPIRARLDKLHDQWVAFAEDPRARLLVWNARDDERSLVEAFVERECDPDRAETPDLFLQLVTPWTEQHGHGVRLAEELTEQAAEAEVAFRWTHDDDDIASLLCALGSLRTQLGERTLAVWLEPSAIHGGRYLLWLQQLVHAAPAGIRFVALGGFYGPLASVEPLRVQEVACALAMPAAFEALTDRAGGGTPDAVFRRLQAQLNARLVAGELVGARATAERALALAREQGWPQLAAAVQLILGAAFASSEEYADAVAAYREAERHASQASGGDGGKLRLIALLGGGGVLFAARAYGPAGESYLRAAALAAELGDARSELDGYRMASLCHAELGDRERAWSVGVQGLRAAAKLPAAERMSSTLPELGAQLRRGFAGDARLTALDEQLANLGRS